MQYGMHSLRSSLWALWPELHYLTPMSWALAEVSLAESGYFSSVCSQTFGLGKVEHQMPTGFFSLREKLLWLVSIFQYWECTHMRIPLSHCKLAKASPVPLTTSHIRTLTRRLGPSKLQFPQVQNKDFAEH